MNDKELFPKAYKEVLEILKYIPKEDYEKIPKYIIENMEKEKDDNYQYKVTEFNDFNKQEMLEETEAILAVLFRDYWATNEQKAKIRNKEMYDRRELEIEKTKNYKGRTSLQVEEKIVENQIEDIHPVKVDKTSFMEKLLSRIKSFFK